MASFDALQATLAHVRNRRLRALAIGAPKRVPIATEIPTFVEVGFPGFNAAAWFGLFAPTNTPQEVISKLNAEALKALALPEIRNHFERAGMQTVGSTPERFAQQVKSDVARYARIAREAGIRAD
jgi:tripartite-type tricarboxylate transporter receptor subunit TctC